MKPWKVLSTRRDLDSPFMQVRTDRCERADGHVVPAYHVIECSEWVTLIPLTPEGKIVLVREYRHAAETVVLGLPGGVSDPGEHDWEAVGRRELAEETGYVPQSMHLVGRCFPNPAMQTNQISFYLALGCERVMDQRLDPDEQIEVVEMPLDDFLNYAALPVQHALHAAALFYTQQYFLKHPHLAPK